MSFQDWQHLRDHAIEHFGDEAPHPATEARIIAAYEAHPEAIEKAVDTTAVAYTEGTIRSPWGILASKADRIANAPANPAGPTSRDREKLIARAEQYVRNAGAHLIDQDDLLDDVFGRNGLLKDHDHPELRERILALYHDLHPRILALEQAEHAKAAREAEARRCPNCRTPRPFALHPCRTCGLTPAVAARLAAERTNA